MTMNHNLHNYRLVDVKSIKIPRGHRPTDPKKVESLAQSIRENGLLQPVGLTSNRTLLYGAHRLAAYQKLGIKKIPAILHDVDGLRGELATIDENLLRRALTAIEETRALARRQEIYEALHPETKQHVAGGKASGARRRDKNRTNDKMSLVPFAEDTAAKIGKSRRTVERKVAIGQKLDKEAAELIADTPVGKNTSELKALANLPAQKQRAIASKVKSGELKSVRKPLGQFQADLPQMAKRGRKGLKMVAEALTALGVHGDFAGALRRIERALKRPADAIGGSKRDPRKTDSRTALVR